MTHLDEKTNGKNSKKKRCSKCNTILSKVRIGDEITYACKQCFGDKEEELVDIYTINSAMAS
jgi:hypothetical protein